MKEDTEILGHLINQHIGAGLNSVGADWVLQNWAVAQRE